jgi:hypothetical protein
MTEPASPIKAFQIPLGRLQIEQNDPRKLLTDVTDPTEVLIVVQGNLSYRLSFGNGSALHHHTLRRDGSRPSRHLRSRPQPRQHLAAARPFHRQRRALFRRRPRQPARTFVNGARTRHHRSV